MTRIEDQLTEAARQLRHDLDRSVDIEEALHRATASSRTAARSRRARTPLLLASAAVVVAVALVGVVAAVDRNDERSVVADGPSTTAVDRPLTSTGAAGEVPFELLVQAAGSAFNRPGSMVYAGVADALRDQWAEAENAGRAPTVDFDRQAALIFTTTQRDGCPEELVSLERNGTTVTPRFTVRPGKDGCDLEIVATTYFVVVDRADVPPQFTLVLAGAPDGSYPEQRLEVDLDKNFADGAPPRDDQGLPVPDGPDLQAAAPGRAITFEGVGPVRLDQVLDPSEVSAHEGGSCGDWGPGEPSHDGDEPLTGLVTGADTSTPKVVDIRVSRNSRYRTASGVGIGTTLATLERIYGDDLAIDRADGWESPTAGLLASYLDVAAVRNGDRALTFYLAGDVVSAVKVSHADFWGDDEGCA